MRLMSGLGLVCALAVCVPCEARALRVDDYLDLERVTAPQISPNGKVIVYTRSHVNVAQDRFDNELWIMDADGRHHRRLMGAASAVRWSPDGTRIAYTAATPSGDEIFVREMNAEGSTTQVTHGGLQPRWLNWSPDGRSLSFLGKVPTNVEWSVPLPRRPGAQWTDGPLVIERLHHRVDRGGRIDDAYIHLFVVAADGGEPRQLTSGPWNAQPQKSGTNVGGAPEWTPDGKAIVFGADRDPNFDTLYARAALHIINVADGRIQELTAPERLAAIIPGPRVSPDGRLIAYFSNEASNTSNYPDIELRVIGVDGSEDRQLIADLPGFIPGRMVFLEWRADSRALYYIEGNAGSYNLNVVSLSGGVTHVTRGAQTLLLSSVSRDGVAVGTLSTADKPPVLVRLSLRDGKSLRVLTEVNNAALKDVQLGRVEEIHYGSTDKTTVQGWIVYPPDFDPSRKYPLMLAIHGGPEGMYEAAFDFWFQEMAAAGYVVLYTNPRGSTGYGGDFVRPIYDAYPGRADFQDLMSGVDDVVRRGFIDTERLYVQGCSGGGTLAAWVVTQTDRFAGSAPQCAIVNNISMVGSTDMVGWWFNHFKKPFWEDPTAWLATSSIMQINKVRTPTLVMVGEDDLRTPVAQSLELFSGLKLVHVPTKLLIFHGEGHTTTRLPSNAIRTQLYMREWFEKWRRVMENGRPVWRERKDVSHGEP